MTSRGQHLAVTATCLVAAVSYAGAVTTGALAWFVLPGVAGAALFASLLVARRFSGTALILGALLVLGWSELVNIWSGTGEGPAARSTFFAAGWTLVAIVAASSRWPALFLEGVGGVVAGAVVLGAAGEVRIVAVATAVCAALTLGLLERSRRNWATPPRRSLAVVLLVLLVGALAAGVALLQAQKDPRQQPELVAAGREYPGIKPPWTDPLGKAPSPPSGSSPRSAGTAQPSSVSSPPPPVKQAHPRRTNPQPRTKNAPSTAQHRPPHTGKHSSVPRAARTNTPPHHTPAATHSARPIWRYVLAAIVLALLVLALLVTARLLAVRIAWRRTRRRLAAGAPDEQVTGAWVWTRMRLEACRLPLAADVSPDLVATGRATDEIPADVHTPLRELATATTPAAFAHGATGDAAAAWSAAGRTEASARDLLTRRRRARLAFRGPVATGRTGS